MTKAKHTPGPWVETSGGVRGNCNYGVNDGMGYELVTLSPRPWHGGPDPQLSATPEERDANLVLIAAAPEMLAVLKSTLDLLLTDAEARNYLPFIPSKIFAGLEYAIAKAEGRT